MNARTPATRLRSAARCCAISGIREMAVEASSVPSAGSAGRRYRPMRAECHAAVVLPCRRRAAAWSPTRRIIGTSTAGPGRAMAGAASQMFGRTAGTRRRRCWWKSFFDRVMTNPRWSTHSRAGRSIMRWVFLLTKRMEKMRASRRSISPSPTTRSAFHIAGAGRDSLDGLLDRRHSGCKDLDNWIVQFAYDQAVLSARSRPLRG